MSLKSGTHIQYDDISSPQNGRDICPNKNYNSSQTTRPKSGTRLALANKIGESEELLFEEPTQVLEIMNDLTVSKIVGS